MLLGESVQRLDVKNRVTLPAKLRAHFARRRRGQQGLRRLPVRLQPGGLGGLRRLAARPARPAQPPGPRDEPAAVRRGVGDGARPAGPGHAAARTADARRARARHRGGRLARPCWRSGTWPPGASARRSSRGVWRMLPNLSHSSSGVWTMSPSCRSRWRTCSSRAPGTPSSTAPSAPAAMPPVLEPYLRGSGTYVAVDRDDVGRPLLRALRRRRRERRRGSSAATSPSCCATWRRRGARVQAILMDLGTSRRCRSTRPHRGFSYASDAPLDMRMDASSPSSPPPRS